MLVLLLLLLLLLMVLYDVYIVFMYVPYIIMYALYFVLELRFIHVLDTNSILEPRISSGRNMHTCFWSKFNNMYVLSDESFHNKHKFGQSSDMHSIPCHLFTASDGTRFKCHRVLRSGSNQWVQVCPRCYHYHHTSVPARWCDHKFDLTSRQWSFS